MERLQKVIANSGYTSRRKAEELIVAGKVCVNGEVVKELGTKVSGSDTITIEGKTLDTNEKKVYYLLNKPRSVISSVSDDVGRTTVVDLIKTISKISIKLIVTLFIGLIITVIIGNCFGFEMSYDNKLDFYLYVIIGIIEFLVVFSDIWSIFYTKELIKNNPIIKMKTFDEKGVFSKYINKAEKYQTSIELHKEQNNNLKNETIIEKYNEVYEGVNSRLILICNYIIKHFAIICQPN